MKKLIIATLILMLCGVSAFAQDPYLQKGSESAENRAVALTKKYQPELVMTGKQTLLFQNKLEEFIIREDKIKEADMSDEDKVHLMARLSEQLSMEMANVLTRPQLRRFNKVKTRLQPVALVVGNTETQNR